MKPVVINKNSLKGYSVSPYNFVSLPKFSIARYNDIQELPSHNSYKDINNKELLNGVIEYTLVAKTPIIVSRGTKGTGKNKESQNEAEFFINNKGDFAIPGSTIRGLVKTNAETLSFSSVVGNENNTGKYENSEIDNSKYMYRDMTSNNALSTEYKKELGIGIERKNNASYSIVKNVKAGYIIKKGNKEYVIEPADTINNKFYLRVDEIELRKIVDKEFENKINFMYSRELLKKEEDLKKAKDDRRKKNNILKDVENDRYSSYQQRISFNYDNVRNRVVKIGEIGRYSCNGWIVCSEYMLGKRGHFIIPESPKGNDQEVIDISYDDILHYKDDLIRTKKIDKKGNVINKKSFFQLPIKSGIEYKKPIFYIKNNNILHFGFAPYLRIFHRSSVLEGVSSNYKNLCGVSYADAIFGFANKTIKPKDSEKFSYKTRVSFEDVIVERKNVLDKDSNIQMLLAEPKPTSYNLYLKQDIKSNRKQLNIYKGEFELRGIKQYWLKDYIELPETGGNKKMTSNIHPIKEGTKFKGRIHFNNLYEDELGLILWSLKLNEGCYQNIGLAKPYGFGRIKVEEVNLQVEDLKKKYTSFSFNFTDRASIDEYINEYKETFSNKYLKGKNIEEMPSVKELMYIKSRIVKREEGNEFRYMQIQRKEFRYKEILPEILQVDDKELLEKVKPNNSNSNNSNRHKDNYRGNNRNNVRNKGNMKNQNSGYSKQNSSYNKSNSRNTRFNDNSSINSSLAEQLEKFKKQQGDK